MIDALTPVCSCVRRTRPDGALCRGCTCASRLRKFLKVLDSFQQTHSGCWPSRATIGQRIGCSERQVTRLVEMAEALGYIMVERQHRRAANLYRVNWPRIFEETIDSVTLKMSHRAGKNVTTSPVEESKCHFEAGQNVPQNLEYMKRNVSVHVERPDTERYKGPRLGKPYHPHITPELLNDPDWLVKSFAPRAAAAGLIPNAQRTAGFIVLACAHQARTGDNPPGLFYALLSDPGRSKHLRNAALDYASQTLKKYRPAVVPTG
ncbi:MAG: helix-turn-helix domain-containing protein [Planctomycetaceae bacterium]|nr:helix-turn-helix domain-containing protein [Planctomycetaceae bacterium]